MDRRPRQRFLAAVFAVLLGAFGLTNPGLLNAVDAWPALAEAASIVETGSVRYERLDPSLTGPELARAVRAAPRSHYGFGLNLVYVPVYAAARAVAGAAGRSPMAVAKSAFSFCNAAAGAATGTLLAAVLLELGFSAATAALVALGLSFGSFLWPLSGISYSDPIQTAFLVAVLLQALRTRRTGRTADVHLLGALAFAAAAMKPFHAVTAAILAVPCLANPAVRRRAAAAAAVWGAAIVAAFALVNWFRQGDPFDAGYRQTMADFRPSYAIPLLLTSFDRGLVWFFPMLVPACFGLAKSARRDPWTAWPVIVALAADLLLLASFQDRHGGNCLGPRYLLFAVPLTAVGLARLVDDAGPRARRAWTALFALSAIWILPMALVQWYLVPVVSQSVGDAGGTFRTEPVPVTFFRLLGSKTVTGPDRIPLQPFSTSPIEGTLDLVHHDNSGWQAWWVKPHPDLPAALRYAGAAALAALALGGAWSLARRREDAGARAERAELAPSRDG
jgi:hypothetical protein